MTKREAEKLIRWVIFSVVVALVPLLFAMAGGWIVDTPRTLTSVLAHGQLLLLAVMLCAAGLGEVIVTGKEKRIAKIFSGGSCVILFLLSSMLFALITTDLATNVQVDLTEIRNASLWVYLFAVLSTAACVYLGD